MTAIIIIVVIIGLLYLSHVIQKKQIEKRKRDNTQATPSVNFDMPATRDDDIHDGDLDLNLELEVVGVTYDNEDGTSRQSILAKCKEDEDIELKRAPMEKYPNAIQVWTEHGCIGYISEKDNKKLAKYMDEGARIYNAGISDLYQNKKGVYNCLVTFDIHVKKHRR